MRTAISALLASLILQGAQAASLLIASGGTDQILRYDSSSGAFLGVFAQGGGMDFPTGLTYGPDDELYVSNFNTGAILKFDGRTGAFIDTFVPGGSGGLGQPYALAFGPDNHLYVASQSALGVLKYHGATGEFLGAFASFSGLVGTGSPYIPSNLAFGPDGNLYISRLGGTSGEDVVRYNITTGDFIDVFATGFGGNGPHDLAFGPGGDLFVTDFNAAAVRRFDGATGASLGTFGGGTEAHAVLFDPDGYMLVSGISPDRVLRFDATTGTFVDIFIPSNSGGLDGPWDMLISSHPVPEPSGTILCAAGLAFIVSARRRRRA